MRIGPCVVASALLLGCGVGADPLPDLAPLALDLPFVIQAPPYPTVQVIWGVTNQGDAEAAGFWADIFYLSSRSNLDSTANFLLTQNAPEPLDPGAVYWMTNQFTLPIIQSGFYYLILVANGYQWITESNTNNNQLAAGFSFEATPPDLTPLKFVVPSSVTGPPYPLVTIAWGVTNQGPGYAAGNWSDWLYLSTNATLDSAATILTASYEYGPVPVGGVYWRTNALRLPVTESGTYYLFFIPDQYNSLYESQTNNNLVVAPVNFNIQPPDLAPIALDLPTVITSPPNPQLTFVWGVTNQGTGVAVGYYSWSDAIYFSTNSVWDSSATSLNNSSYEVGPIDASNSYWRTNILRVPITQSGTYYFFLKVDAFNTLLESNEENNQLMVAVSFIVQPPDLVPLVDQIPRAYTGTPNSIYLPLVWGVTNQGSGMAQGPFGYWYDGVFISTNAVFDSQAIDLAGFLDGGPLAAGSSYWRTNDLGMPVTQSGRYYLIFVTDRQGDVYETNKLNNVAVVPIDFTLLPPDLAPIALQAPPVLTGPPNPSLTIVWGVTNQGIGPAVMPGNSWWDLLYFSSDAVVDPFDSVIVSQSEPGPFNPGESYWHTNTLQLPVVSTTNGYLILRADGYGQLYELDKANNTLAVPLTVNILSPDLAPIAFLVPNSVTSTPRPSLTFIWGVTNQGAGVADPGNYYYWTDSIYVSTNNTWDNTALLVGQMNRLTPVPAGGSYWQTNVFTTPVLQSGTYYFFLVTDDSHGVYESNFGNNTMVTPVALTIQPPDLAVLDFQAPAALTGPPGPPLTFIWAVTNQGTGSALGNWADWVYLSSKSAYDNTATVVFQQFEYGPLAPGETYWRTNTQNLPVTQSGNYYLLFETDQGNALAESDTTNNWVSLPISVTILPPDLAPVALQVTNLVIGPPFPSVMFVWGVTNLGPGTAVSQSSWQDQLSLCSTSGPGPNCNPFGPSWESGPIPAGGSYWRTNTYRVPVVASGTYYFSFEVDDYHGLYESSFTNNELTVPVTFQIQPPDLAPIVLQAPRSVTGAPNPQVKLSWGVTNQGSGSAIGNAYWSDRIYLSTSPEIAFDTSFVVDNAEYGPVTPGGNYWRSQTVTLPVTQSGTYYLIFVTDVNQVLYDANYSNNTVVVPIACNIMPPDLAPIFFQAPTNISGSAITNVTFVWAVTNQGTGSADGSWCDSVFVSTDPQVTWTLPVLFTVCRQEPLPPGGSYWNTNSAPLPVTQSGNYYFILSTDSGNSVVESTETNNNVVIPVSITAGLPDLAPVALQVPQTVSGSPNLTLSVVYAITNRGPGVAIGQWWDQIYLSQTNILDGWAFAVTSSYEQGPVLPGQSYWRTNHLRVPVARSGLYYFLLKTDTSDNLPEANESNNIVAVAVTIAIQPSDVAVIDLQAPASISGPTFPELTLSWGITNQGVGQAEPSLAWYQTVLVSTVPVIDSNAIIALSLPVTNALPPGAIRWFTNDVFLPLTTGGQYYLLVTVNANNGLGESNTNNDLAVVPLTYQQRLPDLAPIALQAPETLTVPPYPWVTLSWGVTNQGPGAATGQRPGFFGWTPFWFDELWLSSSSNLDSSAAFVSETTESNSVAAGGSYWRSSTVQLPISQSGNYYLFFVANYYDNVIESDLSNNTVVVPLSVTVNPPDLAPFIFQAPGFVSGQSYPQITVVWGVTNQGIGPALPPPPYAAPGNYAPPLADALYLSPTPTLDNPSTYSWVAMWPRTTPVLPGTSYRQTNTLTVPVSASGSYYLIFRTDANQAVTESDESNNSAVLPITFRLSPPADLTALVFIAPRTITGPGNPLVTVAWHVLNQGLGPATGEWRDNIYLWAGPEPAISLGSFPVAGPLLVGGDYWMTNTVILPVSQSGDYQLNLFAGGGLGFFDLDYQDNSLTVPITVNITGPPAVRLADPEFFTNGVFRLSAYGAAGAYYTLQGSVDFTNWSRVLDFVCAQDPMTLYDSQVGNFAWRFYRIAPMTNSPMLQLDIGTPRVWTSNGLLLKLDGPVGALYQIEASTDLVAWQKVTSFSTSVTPTYFVDPSAIGYGQRFYRAVLLGQ